MTTYKVPVLLVGFNRPNEFAQRLDEILSWDPPKIYISIDGPRNLKDESLVNQVVQQTHKFKDLKNIVIQSNSFNLGLSKHITSAIDKVLEKEESLIIIEDDIKMSNNVYKSISRLLTNQNLRNIGIVGGFSALPLFHPILSNLLKNKWRPTIRINIWGWGVRRNVWALYRNDISELDYTKLLESSKTWKKLSDKEKKIWLGRFNKVARNPNYTWDFQVQFLSFRYDLQNYLPRYRSVDNLGFNSDLGTNNKNRRSRYYLGYTDSRSIEGFSRNMLFNFINIKIELLTDTVPSISEKIKKLKKII